MRFPFCTGPGPETQERLIGSACGGAVQRMNRLIAVIEIHFCEWIHLSRTCGRFSFGGWKGHDSGGDFVMHQAFSLASRPTKRCPIAPTILTIPMALPKFWMEEREMCLSMELLRRCWRAASKRGSTRLNSMISFNRRTFCGWIGVQSRVIEFYGHWCPHCIHFHF